MSNRDRVAKNQSGNSGEIPKLPIGAKLQVKLNPATSKVAFAMWKKGENGGQGEYVYGEKPIKGLLIGHAMMLKAYSDKIGRNGGSLTSAPYVSKDNIVLFEPTPTGYKKAIQGTKAVVEVFITTKYPDADRASVSVLFYVYVFPTKTKPGQLMEIETNASIAFDMMKTHKGKLTENFVILTPTLYSTTDRDITVNGHTILGKFAAKNPPKYAKVTVGEAIPDELYDGDDVGSVLDAWDAWVKFQTEKTEVKEKEEPETPNTQFNDNRTPATTNNAGFRPGHDPDPWNKKGPSAPLDEEEESDLPF